MKIILQNKVQSQTFDVSVNGFKWLLAQSVATAFRR